MQQDGVAEVDQKIGQLEWPGVCRPALRIQGKAGEADRTPQRAGFSTEHEAQPVTNGLDTTFRSEGAEIPVIVKQEWSGQPAPVDQANRQRQQAENGDGAKEGLWYHVLRFQRQCQGGARCDAGSRKKSRPVSTGRPCPLEAPAISGSSRAGTWAECSSRYRPRTPFPRRHRRSGSARRFDRKPCRRRRSQL